MPILNFVDTIVSIDQLLSVRNKPLPMAIRKVRIKHFIEGNKMLFDKFDEKDTVHASWKTGDGRKIVELARKQIGYSCSTANADIFYTLFRKYIDNSK